MLTLIDGDYILWAAASAAASPTYFFDQSFIEDGSEFKRKRDIIDYCDYYNIDQEAIKCFVPTVADVPVSTVYGNVGSMVNDCIHSTGSDGSHIVFLSDKDSNTFRHRLYPKYKANRCKDKPPHFQDARDFMLDEFNTVDLVGIEADDGMGIVQTFYYEGVGKYNTAICSPDKDMRTIPGMHYDPKKKIFEYLSELEAVRRFWIQMLMGDSADNIFGLKAIGNKRAHAELDWQPDDLLETIVRNKYRLHSKQFSTRKEADDYFDLQYELLRILQYGDKPEYEDQIMQRL